MARVFGNGVPTDVDVQRLADRFGVPTEGALLPYDEIADTIKSAYGTNRYASVFVAWRKRLLKVSNLVLKAQPDKRAYLVLDANGRIAQCLSWEKGMRKKARQTYVVAGMTDASKLSSDLNAARTVVMHNAATMLQSSRMLSRRALPELPASNVG